MVSKLDILVKCITLLQRERELVEMSELNPSDTSKDLVKTIIDLYKEERKPLSGGDSTIIEDIKNVSGFGDKKYEAIKNMITV